MKKLLSLFLITCVVILSGCSCSKEGKYEFEYFVLDNKKYFCTDKEEMDSTTGPVCAIYDDMEILLSKDGKMIKMVDDVVVEESWYKIEDGKLFVSLANQRTEKNYIERGTYKKGNLTIKFDDLMVVFEK